jgi:hypothetical protein
MFGNLMRGIGSFFTEWLRNVRRDLGKPAYRRSLIRW